tara:strand:+ start:35343 stop:36950 length:1608 start_codon:yes stop_codon:yes gene_type:complete
MTWFKATSLTIANNSAVATVVSGEDISNIQAGDGLIVGAFTPVEIKRVYIDANNNRFIELVGAWLNATQTAVPSRVLPTSGDFAGAVQALKDATALLSNNFASLDSWYSAMGNVVLTAQDGTEYTARTFQQMDTDVQAIQDNNQAIIDDSVSEKIAKIRYSKLDNPLCHLFKKNKLVDTLNGLLSWTRASNATYIDRYGVLKYAAIDEPRQEKEGWLIEGSGTNLITYSNDFSNAAWSKSNLTLSQDGTLSPDNVSQAYKVTLDAPGVSTARLIQSVVTTLGLSKVSSVYIKGVAGETLKIEARTGDNVISGQEQYILSGEWESLTSDLVTDWSGQSNVNVSLSVRVDTVNTANNFYVAFAQLEQLPFASSYIPTTDAPATRSADIVSANCLNNSPFANDGFSVSCRVSYNAINAPQILWQISDSTNSRARLRANNTYLLPYLSDGVNEITGPGNNKNGEVAIYTYIYDKLGFYFSRDDIYPVAKDLLSADIDEGGTMYFGASPSNTECMFGHIQGFKIYDFALNSLEAAFLAGE